MSKREWAALSENDFETMLEANVAELPPDDVAEDVTPWEKAMIRVLAGMALCAVTLNFWNLQYILPAVGTLLLLLGFRTLRRENKWFRGCYIISAVRAAYFFPVLILNTTFLRSRILTSPVVTGLGIAAAALTLVLLLCFWRGLRTVQQKAGFPPQAEGVLALIIWHAAADVLAFMQYSGWVIGIAMIAGYVLILRVLYHLSKEMEEAGYAVQAAPVKVTDRSIVCVLTAILVLGCTCGYLFGSRYPMKWSPAVSQGQERQETQEIRHRLLELGFPEHVLNDLTEEEIASCRGALQVVVNAADEPVNDGWEEIERDESGDVGYIKTVYDVKELHLTGVAVQIPGEQERWKIFHHFRWTADPGFPGTESIRLAPAYGEIPDGWASVGETTGRVLADSGGETFEAPFYSLEKRTYILQNWWGGQTRTDVFASFSLPGRAENQRGYLTYVMEEKKDGFDIFSAVSFTHQRTLLQYPAMSAEEWQKTSGWNDSRTFKTVNHILRFYETEDGIEIIR